MLQGTQHYVNHISDKGLMHITAPHMCAYTYTRTHGGKKYIKKKKNHTPKAWYSPVLKLCLFMFSSSGLFWLFLCASNSPVDDTFVSYLYSHLCTFLHRTSPRQECSSWRESIRLLPLTKPASSNTGTRKDKSSALHAYSFTLPVNLQEHESLMNIYRHHGIKH